MKKRQFILSFALLFSLYSTSFAQSGLKAALQGEWVKDKVKLKDGSTIFDETISSSSFILEFRNDSLIVTLNGATSIQRYTVQDSTISYRGTHYKVARFDKPILELQQINQSQDVEPLEISLVYKPVYDLRTSVNSYIAKNGEEVFTFQPDVVEPKFLNIRYSAMDYIFSNFNFPEYKKGGFVVRFVITKNGEMQGLRLVASSDPKYDNRLITAVKKTEGDWLPASYLGEPVNCEVEYNFDLDWSKPKESVQKQEEEKMAAAEYFDNGRYYFGLKNYKNSVYYLDKAIEKDPYMIDAYYLRAASYIFRQETDKACGDYLQLKVLNQSKATTLYDKYCGDYTPETTE